MRSMKVPMRSAGISYPMVEWGLCRLQYASMNSTTACLASSLVAQERSEYISFLRVAKK